MGADEPDFIEIVRLICNSCVLSPSHFMMAFVAGPDQPDIEIRQLSAAPDGVQPTVRGPFIAPYKDLNDQEGRIR